MKTDQIEILPPRDGAAAWSISGGGSTCELALPVFQIDGERLSAVLTDVTTAEPQPLANGATLHTISGRFAADPQLTLVLELRIAPDSPVVRFRYRLLATTPRRLTKSAGTDDLCYLATSLADLPAVTELRLSEFNDMVHAFVPSEHAIAPRHFAATHDAMGPILIAGDGSRRLLLAYEHGSQTPNAFLQFHCEPDRSVRLMAVKGTYYDGRVVDSEHAYETLWFHAALVAGDTETLADAYRDFILRYQNDHAASREPWIFYNTWAWQERNRWWNDKTYLDSMHQERILEEIEIAHRMGIEVYVIDTGWYGKTGDWQVNTARFPDFAKVRQALADRGMKLGLWFAPLTAALTSQMHATYRDCLMTWDGEVNKPHEVWETEASQNLCLVSRFGDAFADELIRVNREWGVTYFKWDAIGQYGCNSPDHDHGTAANTLEERTNCYAFELGRAMEHIVRRLQAACPEAIVDFDITEGGRSVGLGFLSVGKYFLINNGPYYQNYNIPNNQAPAWSNIFVHPGPARTWICRTPLSIDRWIPSVLYLTHYLPDDPAGSQLLNIASLILGQNGIWGDLATVSPEGVERFGQLLGLYKQVRHDITAASPRRTGQVGGSPEIHEKIAANGRGAVVLFAGQMGDYRYITERPVAAGHWATDGVQVSRDSAGLATISANFPTSGAAIVFFGVTAESLSPLH